MTLHSQSVSPTVFCSTVTITVLIITNAITLPRIAATTWTEESDAEELFPESKLGKERPEQPGNSSWNQIVTESTEKIVNFNDGSYNEDFSRDCQGVCIHSNMCTRLGGSVKGFCGRSGSSCCEFGSTCKQASKELVSFFHSPGYPAPIGGTIICQHDVILNPGTCAVRLEFLEFNITRPLDRGICNVDQFLLLRTLEGPAFPRCGELTGYSTVVNVDATYDQPLTMLAIIQSSRETHKWSIKISQMRCDIVKPIQDYPNCGKKYVPGQETTFPDVSGEKPRDEENSVFTPLPSLRSPEDFHPDNAFYIEYLKRTHQVMYDGPSPSPNQTLCKNSLYDILKEKLQSNNVTISKTSRIIRGEPALANEFPWQVSIQDRKGHVCGGAILNEFSILTASHCFLSVAPVLIRQVKVIVGDLNLNLTTDAEHQEVEIYSVLFHSHFDPYYLQNDIAVIKLKQALRFRRGIQPVCLPEQGNSYVNRVALISGWGAINFPMGKLATHLQKVRNNIIENSECKRILKIEYIFSTMMCAVTPRCAGTCFGDSGGPLVVEKNNVSRVVGIVSFGIGGCALLPFWPDVYTRVTEYLRWLSFATSRS